MGTQRKIIIVEDDEELRDLLIEALVSDGCDVLGAENEADFRQKAGMQEFDLAIIDVNLPDGSGYAIARSLRSSSNTRIIILTGRDAVVDRVESYASGADIHLVKPTKLAELLAAMESLLSRRDADMVQRSSSGWRLNVRASTLTSPAGDSVELSPRESALMKRLMRTPGKVVQTDELRELLAMAELDANSQALTMLVSRLRRRIQESVKLEAPIQTVFRRGFAFRDS